MIVSIISTITQFKSHYISYIFLNLKLLKGDKIAYVDYF